MTKWTDNDSNLINGKSQETVPTYVVRIQTVSLFDQNVFFTWKTSITLLYSAGEVWNNDVKNVFKM